MGGYSHTQALGSFSIVHNYIVHVVQSPPDLYSLMHPVRKRGRCLSPSVHPIAGAGDNESPGQSDQSLLLRRLLLSHDEKIQGEPLNFHL